MLGKGGQLRGGDIYDAQRAEAGGAKGPAGERSYGDVAHKRAVAGRRNCYYRRLITVYLFDNTITMRENFELTYSNA